MASPVNNICVGHPLAGKEFDLKNNDGKRPDEVVATHKKKRFAFRCLRNREHGLFMRTPYARAILDKGCPRCFEEKTRSDNRPNSVGVKEPHVAMQWHPAKNRPLTPYDLTPGSHVLIWFICEHGHERELRVCDKVRRPQCSQCMSDVAKANAEWHKKPRSKSPKR